MVRVLEFKEIFAHFDFSEVFQFGHTLKLKRKVRFIIWEHEKRRVPFLLSALINVYVLPKTL